MLEVRSSPLVHQAGGPRQKTAEMGIRSEAKKDHMKQSRLAKWAPELCCP